MRSDPDKLCPSCGRVNTHAATHCACGHQFGLSPMRSVSPPVIAPPVGQFAPPGVVPVRQIQPSAVAGPICPRCGSPYMNYLSKNEDQASGAVVLLVFIGICLWPLWVCVPFAMGDGPSTNWNCHNCGLNTELKPKPRQRRAATSWTYVAAFVLGAAELIVWILWRSYG